MTGYIILCILLGLQLLVGLPYYFTKKNAEAAAKADYEEYLTNLLKLDKQYGSHLRALAKNLNLVNYWLKTGNDPNDELMTQKKNEAAEQFNGGNMGEREASKWVNSVTSARNEKRGTDIMTKFIRKKEFSIKDADCCDLDQGEMTFHYLEEPMEYIYYCVTPEALEKKYYRMVIYFTTCRPSQIPLVYPYKYEGAQMLSLYKHPAQAIWFLTNWKLIRENLEVAAEEEITPELNDAIKDFDL